MYGKIFDNNEDKIREYCEKNGLSFEKTKYSPRSCGKTFVYVQHYDPERGKMGLLDETPMPVTLIITTVAEGLLFEQTEHTAKYLSL